MQQFFALTFQHFGYRNARPFGHDFGDFFLGYLVAQQSCFLGFPGIRALQLLFQRRNNAVLQLRHLGQIVGAAGGFQFDPGMLQLLLDGSRILQRRFFRFPNFFQVGIFLFQIGNIFFQYFKAFSGGGVGFFFQCDLFDLQLDQTAVKLIHFFRLRIHFHSDAASGFVDQIDGLVGQLPISDITIRQTGCRHDGGVGDIHTVMHFVFFFQATQDGDSVFNAGLVHQHFLETPLQSSIFFDVFTVFVQCGRADAMQFAARQRRLEHVARIHCAFGFARADHCV